MQDSPTPYLALGTPSAPVTLTVAFAGNRNTFFCRNFKRFHVEGKYTPAADNQQGLILFETSNDLSNSGPTNFFPFSTDSSGTTEIDIFADSGYLMGSASGIPLVIPGDKTSTNGTAISFSETFDDLSAEWLRVSARDSGAANFGTLFLRITFFPN